MTIRFISGYLGTSGGQSKRSLDTVTRTLRGSGAQVSFRCAFIIGTVEMLRAKGQIPLIVPFRRPHVQLTPTSPQHGRIGALLDQCVRK